MRSLAFVLAVVMFAACGKDDESPTDPAGTFTVAVSAGAGGTVSATGGTFNQSVRLFVRATPYTNYKFIEWTKTGNVELSGISTDTTTITVNGVGAVTANFARVCSVTVLSNNTDYGTVTPTEVQTDAVGTTFTVTASPKEGCSFMNWSSTGWDLTVADENAATTTATIGTVSGTIMANFKMNDPTILVNPTAPYILYWSGGRMQVGHWDSQVTLTNILLFKFGSVVGFYGSSNNRDAWEQSNIVFEPTTTKAGSYGEIPSWATYPSDADGIEVDGYISSREYHNLENVRAGLGDPCKLAGLTKTDIDNGIFDNGKYRLPKDGDNSVYYYARSPGFIGYAGSPGYGLRLDSDDATLLPAAGCRNILGATADVNFDGYYWSSKPGVYDKAGGFCLQFCSGSVRKTFVDARSGLAIRCIPQSWDGR